MSEKNTKMTLSLDEIKQLAKIYIQQQDLSQLTPEEFLQRYISVVNELRQLNSTGNHAKYFY